MNRNILALSAVAAVLSLAAAPAMAVTVAGPTPAAPVVDTININGSVTLLCGGAGLASTTLPLSINLADANGFINDSAYVGKSAVTGNLWCNGVNSTATVTHVNLTNSTAPNALTTGFTHVVTFVPQVTFTPSVGTATVINGDVANTKIGLFDGTATVVLQSGGAANANVRPLAGAYSGSVSFTVTPAS